jgi:shikimate dehydrogenase
MPLQFKVGLIGDPVAHSFSPRLQQAAFDALGIPARYELWQTTENELAARLTSLLDPHCLGANVTIPHKEAVLPLLDIVDPIATRIGAVNTIVHRDRYLYGYNTDAPGLLRALAEQGIGDWWSDEFQDQGLYRNAEELQGRHPAPPGDRKAVEGDAETKRMLQGRHPAPPGDRKGSPLPNYGYSLEGYTAVLLGAGGAARAAAFALASASVSRLIIINRHLERAQQLVAAVQQSVGTSLLTVSPSKVNDPRDYPSTQVFCLSDPDFLIPHPKSLIINTTPVGMHEDASPLPGEVLARFSPDTFVFDMIYNPTETRLLIQARTLGLRAVNGLSMLLHQGALAFTLWTGQSAPLEVMRAALQ